MYDSVRELFLQQLNTNQFLSGGVILGLLTSLLYSLKSIPGAIWQRIKRKVTYSVTVDQGSDLYDCFQVWLNSNYSAEIRSPRATYSYNHESESTSRLVETSSPPTQGGLSYIYNNDYFIIRKGLLLIRVSSKSEKMENAGHFTSLFFREIVISGVFAKKAIQEIISDVIKFAEEKRRESKDPKIHQWRYREWIQSSSTYFKDINSIFLKPDVKDRIISDMGQFLNLKDFYVKRSIPYRRGYCLYGPPGTGKSSLVSALAKKFIRDLYIMNLNSFSSDEDFNNSFSHVRAGSILLVEDIDSFFNKRKSKTKVTFSSFLNTVSGVASKHDVILIITTNKPDTLDDALVRAGRIDLMLEIPKPTIDEVNEFLRFFYERDITTHGDLDLSMADVENVCIQHKDSPDRAVSEIQRRFSIKKLKVS